MSIVKTPFIIEEFYYRRVMTKTKWRIILILCAKYRAMDIIGNEYSEAIALTWFAQKWKFDQLNRQHNSLQIQKETPHKSEKIYMQPPIKLANLLTPWHK